MIVVGNIYRDLFFEATSVPADDTIATFLAPVAASPFDDAAVGVVATTGAVAAVGVATFADVGVVAVAALAGDGGAAAATGAAAAAFFVLSSSTNRLAKSALTPDVSRPRFLHSSTNTGFVNLLLFQSVIVVCNRPALNITCPQQ
jgi:hypothetical protein